MVKIIIKEARDNARNRRRESRRLQREQDSADLALQRKIAIELNGGRAGVLAEKASGAIESVDKEPPPETGGGDAMTLRVNHAHQRRPSKKWS
ncbi:hypothetical protein [Pantoea septica]|uniref:hypothetical protein n=1 Tax=Pantoea septica TaxID=472695 RepID=UPI0025EFE1CD|nr:hypothetical protein [Pantoea septica]